MAVDLSNILNRIANAKAINNFSPKLDIGRHKVALMRFAVKESQKGGGPLVEADFKVMESTNPSTVGETRGWAWFISAKGEFAAAYEEARAKEFIETCGKCIGDTSGAPAMGAALAAPEQHGRGLVLDVEIVKKAYTNKQGVAKEINNATWRANTQTMEQLAEVRAALDKMEAGGPTAATVAAPAPTPVAATGLGLAGLLGRK